MSGETKDEAIKRVKMENHRWAWERRFWRFNVELSRFINRQAISVGVCVNWNFLPSIELDLFLVRLYIEYSPELYGRKK